MEHEISDHKGAMVVAFKGDVDLEQAPHARRILLECVGKGRPVFVDLSGIGYIDSSGVASLVEAFQMSRKNRQPFALVSVSPGAMRVLELARLNKVFSIYKTLDEAAGAAG